MRHDERSDAQNRVQARFPSNLHANHYGGGVTIIHLPFEPENVGARKLGWGQTEERAWEDADRNTSAPTLPSVQSALRDGSWMDQVERLTCGTSHPQYVLASDFDRLLALYREVTK